MRSYLGPGDERALADDVLDGLTRPFKEIPPKHFYDARGAELFDRICELPEYYPTRAERGDPRARARTIVAARRGAAELVELGSGTRGQDARAARRAGRRRDAAPLRAARRHRDDGARHGRGLDDEFPGSPCTASSATSSATSATSRRAEGPAVVAFLGGTIGNFTPGTRRRFLRRVARLLRPGSDHLLLGADLVKDPAVLEAAYDDAAGRDRRVQPQRPARASTASSDADFEVEPFEHVAFFDREHEWIEMRLRALRRMDVRVGALGLDVHFAAREEMRTEISAKFTRARLEADLAAAGLELVRIADRPGRAVRALARPPVIRIADRLTGMSGPLRYPDAFRQIDARRRRAAHPRPDAGRGRDRAGRSQWFNGVSVQSTIYNPCLGISEVGAVAQAGYRIDPGRHARGRRLLRAREVRRPPPTSAGAAGTTDMAAELDVVLPPGVRLAIDAKHPVQCF